MTQEVYDDILRTHAKQSLAIMPFGNFYMSYANETTIAEVIADETTLAPNDNPLIIPCHSATTTPLSDRKPSLRKFSEQKLPFDLIQSILIQSFSLNRFGHRPYPSAGGVYSIEPVIFLFSERVSHHEPIVSGCYHFKPRQNRLELIKTLHLSLAVQQFYHGMIVENTSPQLCILYLAHVEKSIFKYRYRGYRHALMEVGSMYQQASMVAQELGLRSSVWSSFNDHQVMCELNLDQRIFLPLTMQFIGYEDNSTSRP
jgi:SagB-type dehydrogenase family enzyme